MIGKYNYMYLYTDFKCTNEKDIKWFKNKKINKKVYNKACKNNIDIIIHSPEIIATSLL